MSTNNPERQMSKLYKMHKKFHTSDLVAPPMMNTKIRWPIFLKSLDACLRIESL